MSEKKKPADYGRYERHVSLRNDMVELIHRGLRTRKELMRVFWSRQVSAAAVDQCIASCVRDGYIAVLRGAVYCVTTRGRELVPVVVPAFINGEYTPPAPMLTRPGALDYRLVPSLAAGQTREYRQHV